MTSCSTTTQETTRIARQSAVTRDEITAVLDGQQRLTALNIGLRGSYADKLPRLWWNNPNKRDRDAIRSWLTRSLLKRGIWGSGLDSLLTVLRTVIDTHGSEAFPAERLEEAMRARGKSLTFEEEEPRAAREYAEHHDLGDVPADITGFNVFYEARRARLLSRLRRLLGTDRHERGTL